MDGEAIWRQKRRMTEGSRQMMVAMQQHNETQHHENKIK